MRDKDRVRGDNFKKEYGEGDVLIESYGSECKEMPYIYIYIFTLVCF